jgi:prephenate dehydrogenase
MLNRLTILGVGLIGGSLARAVKQAGTVKEVVGWGRDAESIRRALALGVIDRGEQGLGAAVTGADVVVVATPIGAMSGILQQLSGEMTDAMTVTDVGSVKGPVVEMARVLLGRHARRFVPGHPIAGDERTGVEASRGDLFRGHRVILTPVKETDTAAVASIRALWEGVGAAVYEMDAVHHDRILAATSHMPHVLAYTLVDCLVRRDASAEILRFAAGGFRDFTRIASSDPTMWRDICLANRRHLIAVLQDFQTHLQTVMALIEQGDGTGLGRVFESAKATRDRFTNERLKD